jgi:hypothetical protein
MPQLSQNLKALLQEVGEGAALINLAVRMTDKPGWTLFKNYTATGCDLVVQRLDSNHEVSQLKIEVKTRQNVVTDRTNRNAVHFTVTANERNSADFVIAYWFDKHAFFVLPSTALKPIKSNGEDVYKFIAYWSDLQKCFTDDSRQWLERWDLIIDKLQ